MQKTIKILVNTSEIGAGTRGASLGPEAMMVAARAKGSSFFAANPPEFLPHQNHLLDAESPYPKAKRIDGLQEVYKVLNDVLSQTLRSDHFPLVLAADHASAGGTIAGIKSAFPDKRIGVIWIDAHADLHSPYTTPSGNLHGMPLSTALGEDNLSCQKNDVDATTAQRWNELKNTGGITPKILAEDLIFAAVRDTEEEEDAIIARRQIKNFKVDEITAKGERQVAGEILERLHACDLIYISFDVDSMDPELTSYGTGTPVAKGLSPIQAENLILSLLESPKVCCLEIVEVNPCLDEQRNKMAETAFHILEKIVEKLSN